MYAYYIQDDFLTFNFQYVNFFGLILLHEKLKTQVNNSFIFMKKKTLFLSCVF